MKQFCVTTAMGKRLIGKALDAIGLMMGAEVCLLAAGGIYGAEGAARLGITGTKEQIQAAAELIKSVADELPCEA
jgi:hypothetical protein